MFSRPRIISQILILYQVRHLTPLLVTALGQYPFVSLVSVPLIPESRRARFGPNGIRQGARRISVSSINVPMKTRVTDYLDVVDCGDVRTSARTC